MMNASIFQWSTIHLSDFVVTATREEYDELERLFLLPDTKRSQKKRDKYMRRLQEKFSKRNGKSIR
jgi:hypothetical protein